MSTYSTYYTIMSMIDGFKSFINLAVMVLTIVASWIMLSLIHISEPTRRS